MQAVLKKRSDYDRRRPIEKMTKLHTYKYLWSKCQKREVVINAWKKLRKGKTNRREVIEIENNFEFYVNLMIETLKETKPGGDKEKEFKPSIKTGRTVIEHGKERKIYCPSIWEQWIHHIVAQVLSPIIIKYSYRYSCGSMPKRGSLYGKKKLEKYTRKGFKYFAKLDIRHFFNSIRLEVAIKELEKIIDDEWFIYLIRKIFMQFEKGLPLGFYISQWIANFILWRLDERILEENPIFYERYMDDMVVIGNNKRKLHKTVIIIKRVLGSLRLKVKGNWSVAKFTYKDKKGSIVGRPIDFMGFVFTKWNTKIRKAIMIRATKFAKRISKNKNISPRQALSMISRIGWFKYTNTRKVWEKYIKEKINIKELKEIIRKYQRRSIYENEMGRRDLQLITGTI